MLSILISLITVLGFSNLEVVKDVDLHAVYVSVLEIEHRGDEQRGQIRIKIFADDLEDAIYNNSQKRIVLLGHNCNKNKVLVNNYFADHLLLKLDDKKVDYDYISCEVNDISIWFTYGFVSMASWSELEIRADYLMELFPGQSNVVSIDYKGQKKMFRLAKGDASKTIILSN